MSAFRWVIGILVLSVVAAGSMHAQDYPNKPIRLIAPEVGGGGDFVARIITQGISAPLGEPIIVDNRGLIAAELVAKAMPDGYTLLLYASPLWLAPYLRDNVSYDPLRDFAPVTLTSTQPNVLVVHPSVTANSVKDLIALAKAKPGALNYSSGSAGSPPHLAAELFKSMAGVHIARIPYKGTGPALNAIVGGEVQILFGAVAAVMPQVKAGRLKALAVTSAQPFVLYPELPTVAASGLPGYQSETLIAIFAPARTPAKIVSRLNQEIALVLKRAEVREKFFSAGVEALGSTPQQLTLVMKSDMEKMGKVIKEAGIRAD